MWYSFKNSVSSKHAFLLQNLSECVNIGMESDYWLLEALCMQKKSRSRPRRTDSMPFKPLSRLPTACGYYPGSACGFSRAFNITTRLWILKVDLDSLATVAYGGILAALCNSNSILFRISMCENSAQRQLGFQTRIMCLGYPEREVFTGKGIRWVVWPDPLIQCECESCHP